MSKQLTHDAMPTVPTMPATFSNIAGGEVIPKLDQALRTIGPLISNTERFPPGSKFKITLESIFELHEDQQSVFIVSAVKIGLPNFTPIATRVFVGPEDSLVVPLLPGDDYLVQTNGKD